MIQLSVKPVVWWKTLVMHIVLAAGAPRLLIQSVDCSRLVADVIIPKTEGVMSLSSPRSCIMILKVSSNGMG